MKERKKPWFDRFLERHPYFPLTISILGLVVAIAVLTMQLLH